MRPQPLICVSDIETSSRWYRRLLGLRGGNAGHGYERLFADDALVLQLHRFEDGHDHGPIGDPDVRPYGNGVLLWFEVDDFEAAMARAAEMKAEIALPRHVNDRPGHWECWLRDPDGYVVVIASRDGTAP